MGLYPPGVGCAPTVDKAMAVTNNRPAHLYTPLFCEENIWQLVRQLVADGAAPETLQVIVISNRQKQVVLFNQRNANEHGYVVWDYHVILRQCDEEGDAVFDFDTRLPLHSDSRDYFTATFATQSDLPESLRAVLRVIPAAEYLHCFYSDRHHMHGVIDDEAFPPWPAIMPSHQQVIRLDQYWDMTRQGEGDSRVTEVEAFVESELK